MKFGERLWRGRLGEGECKPEAPDEMMTLEDFLAKAGVGSEDEVEDIKVTVSGPQMLAHQRLSSGGLFGFDPLVQGPYQALQREEKGWAHNGAIGQSGSAEEKKDD